MVKQPLKQMTLTGEAHGEPGPTGYQEIAVTRSIEEGELLAYRENVGRLPNNLSPEHPGYKAWTWKTRRNGHPFEVFPNENET